MALGNYYVRKTTTSTAPVKRMFAKTSKKIVRKRKPVGKIFKSTNFMTLPREAIVKLNYKDVRGLSLASGASSSTLYNCMAGVPSPTVSNNPANGDKFITGFPEYSVFYQKYTPIGAKIKVTITNPNTTNLLRFVVLPRRLKETVTDDLADLDAMSYEQLISMPSAKYKTVSLGSAGFPIQSVSHYRSTKYMLDIKDIKDNEDILFSMPIELDTSISYNSGASVTNCWYYYVRVFNIGTGTSTGVELRTEMIYYMMFRNRQFIEQQVVAEI